jgi:hypothetical protein
MGHKGILSCKTNIMENKTGLVILKANKLKNSAANHPGI